MIPEKCINCIHHKKISGTGDVKAFDFPEEKEVDYCDYTEYYNEIGVPVPYPYFFTNEYPCKGHEVKESGKMTEEDKIKLLIETFIVPMENEHVCDELCGYEFDEKYESWCSRNCGVTNSGKCPDMNCYLKWLEMKESEE